MSCCPANSWPSLQTDYVPKWANQVLTKEGEKDMVTYVSGTGEEKKACLVLPDIFGIEGGRNKAICDQLQQNGYYTVMPDYFFGGDFKGDLATELGDWAKTFPYELHRAPIARALAYIESKGFSKIVAIGFCWGCWVSFKMAADDEFKHRILGCADCHPSLKLEPWIWNNSMESLAEAAKDGFPQLLLSADNDPAEVREGGSVISILQTKPDSKSKVVDFPTAKHGWINRGDTSDAQVKEDVRVAMEHILTFFNEVSN